MLAGREDEYFLSKIVPRDDVYPHPDATDAAERFLRGLQEPRATGFRTAYLRDTFTIPDITPGRLRVGTRAGYRVNRLRLGRVPRRIVQGLWYHERGDPLPLKAKIAVWFEDGLVELHPLKLDDLRLKIVAPLLSAPEITIGNGVFSYRYCRAIDRESASAWLLGFYGCVWVLCMVVPEFTE